MDERSWWVPVSVPGPRARHTYGLGQAEAARRVAAILAQRQAEAAIIEQRAAQPIPAPPGPIVVVSKFGRRFHPVQRKWLLHNGIDIRAAVGTPIQSLGAGEVVKVGYTDRGGLGVSVALDSGWTTFHGHLSRLFVREGDDVDAGQLIGLSGASGQVTGPHVHFAIFAPSGEAVDPLRILPPGSWTYV